MKDLSSEDKTKVTRFFNDLYLTYGPYSPYSLGWSSKENQFIRFKILSEISNLEGTKILDVGCGLGDFYGFLEYILEDFQYLGVDITNHLIEAAKNKYSKGNFELKDVFEVSDNSFDYAFASGVFSYNIPGYFEKYFSIIQKMYSIARKGVGFNMLNKHYHDIDDLFMAYDPKEIELYCKEIFGNVKLVEGYLEQDFTIYIYK